MYKITVNTGAATYTVENLGPQGSQANIEINGQGSIHFNCIGVKQLGPSTKTWGVCITFRDRVWVFRYEGGGDLEVTYNATTESLAFNGINGVVDELTS